MTKAIVPFWVKNMIASIAPSELLVGSWNAMPLAMQASFTVLHA